MARERSSSNPLECATLRTRRRPLRRSIYPERPPESRTGSPWSATDLSIASRTRTTSRPCVPSVTVTWAHDVFGHQKPPDRFFSGLSPRNRRAHDRAVAEMESVLAMPRRLRVIHTFDTLLEETPDLSSGSMSLKMPRSSTADDDDLVDLVRIRPADVNGARQCHSDIRSASHPMASVTVPNRACANGTDPGRRHTEQVVEDRNVVWRQVPYCVHVRPDRAEARPLRVEVVDVAHVAVGQVLFDLLEACVVEERVTHHEDPSDSLGEIDRLGCILARRRKGFLDKHVFARLERSSGQVLFTSGSVGHCRDRVGVGPGDRLRRIICDSDGTTATDGIKAIRSAVADDGDAGIAELAEDAKVIRSPVTGSNDGDACGRSFSSIICPPFPK